MNKQNEFVGMNAIDAKALSNGQWSMHNCKYSESGLRWRFQDKDHNVTNVISKNTIKASYPLLTMHDDIGLKIIGHDITFDIGFIKAPEMHDTLHVWWDDNKKSYTASYTQCGCSQNPYDDAEQTCAQDFTHKEVNDLADAWRLAATKTTVTVKETLVNAGEKARDVTHRATEHIKDAVHSVADTAKDLTHKGSENIKKMFGSAVEQSQNMDQEDQSIQLNSAQHQSENNQQLAEQTIIIIQHFDSPDSHVISAQEDQGTQSEPPSK